MSHVAGREQGLVGAIGSEEPRRDRAPGPRGDVEVAAIVRVLGNPIRIGFMRSLRGRAALSPVEYSRLSGEDLREVARHVRALSGAGLIAVVEVVPRRGAFEHRYTVGSERGEAALEAVELLAGV